MDNYISNNVSQFRAHWFYAKLKWTSGFYLGSCGQLDGLHMYRWARMVLCTIINLLCKFSPLRLWRSIADL